MPDEDKYLCEHLWRDMYAGAGVDIDNPYRAYQAFFCEKCLQITVKSWNQSRFKLSPEFLQRYEEEDEASA